MATQLDSFIASLNQQDAEDSYVTPPVPLGNIPTNDVTEGYEELITEPYDNRYRNYSSTDMLRGKKNLTELAEDDEFSKRALRFLEGVGSNDNIFEYLRDSDYSLSSAVVRSFQTGSWTEEQKDDYAYLRNEFNNSNIEGFKEWFGAFKDIGVDLVTDPLNLISAIFAIPTGGQSLTTNAALAVAARQGVNKFTKAQLQDKTIKAAVGKEAFKQGVVSSTKIGALEGASWNGLHNYFLQDIDIGLGLSTDLDFESLTASTALGAGLGGALVGGIRAGTMKFKKAPETNENMPSVLKEKESKFSNEDTIEKTVDPKSPKQSRETVLDDSATDEAIIGDDGFFSPEGREKNKNRLNKVFANSIGKPVTEFLGYLKRAPSFENLLASIRYDYKATMTKGQEGVTVIKLTTKDKDGNFNTSTESFGENFARTNGEYQFGILKAFNVLYRVGWRAKILQNQNDDLAELLRDPTITLKKTGVDDKGEDIFGAFDQAGVQLKGNTKYKNFEKLDEDVLTAFIGARQQLDRAFIDGQASGVFKAGTTKVKNYLPRLFNYGKLADPEKRAAFENKLIEAGHADPINEKEFKTFYEIDPKTKKPTETKVRGVEENAVGQDELIFKEKLSDGTTRGINFIEKAGVVSGLVDDATPEQLLLAKKLKANKIVQDMLDNRWTPMELRLSGVKNSAATGYLQPRRFTNLADNEISDVLENDVQTILETYFTNISRTVSRAKYFGKTITEIMDTKIQPIINELASSGMSLEDANKIGNKALKMIEKVAGFETYSGSLLKSTKFGRNFADFGKISQQLAHLPLATLSSITEPLILLSRSGLSDAPAVAGDMARAIGKEGSNIINRVVKLTQRKVTGKKVLEKSTGKMRRVSKGLKDLDDETWSEIYKTGLALEQAVLERLEGLMGEGVESGFGKALQQGFFKTNLLTQWTKAVQLASFTTGKRIIKKNARLLSEGNISTSQKKYLTGQLNELGMEAKDAIAWHRKYSKGGELNDSLANQDIFYKQNITRGANRFTKEIILNPSTSEANRPLWFSMPSMQLLVQFAGYPTVFNNTILKRFSNESLKNPGSVGIAKVLPTMVLMTSVAHVGNLIRSNGNSAIDRDTGGPRDEGVQLLEAVRRWGGTGPFDYAYRYNSESERNVGAVTAALKTLAGPAPQDVIDAILYRKGVAEIIATNLPGYSAYDIVLGDGTKKELKRIARGSAKEKPKKNPYLQFSKGGIVLNVPNVKDEPDEMVNRITGVPFDETAGVILVDEEERLFKHKGGKVHSKLQERKAYAEGKTVTSKLRSLFQKVNDAVFDNVVEVEDTEEDHREVVLQRVYERLRKTSGEYEAVPYEEFKNNALAFSNNVKEAESNNRNLKRGSNPLGSSASGLYQLLEGSVPTAVNRGKKFFKDSNIFDEIIKMNDSSVAPQSVQDALFFSNIFESKGSDARLGPALFLGDKNAAMNAYLYNHHTLSSKVDKYNDSTIKRAENIWGVPYQKPYTELPTK